MVKAITYILKEDATVGTLVGANAASDTKKVYPVIATQAESYPLITVRQASRIPEQCRGQRSTTFNYGYEVSLYCKDYDEMDSLEAAIVDAIENVSISAPINGVTFTDRIRNTNSVDGEYLDGYKCYSRILSFATVVYEDQAT